MCYFLEVGLVVSVVWSAPWQLRSLKCLRYFLEEGFTVRVIQSTPWWRRSLKYSMLFSREWTGLLHGISGLWNAACYFLEVGLTVWVELSTPWQLGPLKCTALFYIYFNSHYLWVFRRTCVSAWPCATACLAVSPVITSSARTHRLTCSSPWWLASSCGRHDPSSLQPHGTLLNRLRKTRWMPKTRVTAFPLDPGLMEKVLHRALSPSTCSYGLTSFGPDNHVVLCCLVEGIRIWVEAPLPIVTVPQALSWPPCCTVLTGGMHEDFFLPLQSNDLVSFAESVMGYYSGTSYLI